MKQSYSPDDFDIVIKGKKIEPFPEAPEAIVTLSDLFYALRYFGHQKCRIEEHINAHEIWVYVRNPSEAFYQFIYERKVLGVKYCIKKLRWWMWPLRGIKAYRKQTP